MIIMKKQLYERHLYLNKNITNLKSCTIREYDMKDAGFSIIKYNKLLDKKTIKWLESLDKKTKNIQVGLILRENFELNKTLMTEFIRIRKKFFELNNIKDYEVLSIKKDAIFTINKTCEYCIIDDYFEFKMKNRFSSYLYINNIEFYYSAWNEDFVVKGLGKNVINKNDFLLDIRKIMKLNETLSYESMFIYLRRYRSDYINYRLPISHYRQLDSYNVYILKEKLLNTEYPVQLDEITEEELKEKININYNYIKYIIPIIGLLL